MTKVKTTEQMFEYATRNRIRFPYKGNASVEDLWRLSKEELNEIYKNLNTKARRSQEESLLDDETKEDETLNVQIGIVKHIVSVLLDEEKARVKEHENKVKKEKILEILAERQDNNLKNASDEALYKMLSEL